MSPEVKTVNCTKCQKEMQVKRSPMKGYKVTINGCFCDDCYSSRTTVYEFGTTPEYHGGYDGIELAIEQMRTANRIWNNLVEIDRFERNEYRRLTTDPSLEEELFRKTEELNTVNQAVNNQKMVEQKKNVKVDPLILAEKKLITSARKVLFTKLKAEKSRMQIENKHLLDALKVDVKNKIDAATDPKTCGLLWTMLSTLVARFKVASAAAKANGSLLKFRRFDGTGTIEVPCSNGLPLNSAYRSDEMGKFQIASELMSDHPKEKRTKVRICVATTKKNKPIWLTLPVVFHRGIPPEADIRHVTVCREIIGGNPRWKLCITVRLDAPEKTKNTAACGINIGWRKRENGIRVAYWVDSNSQQGELILPTSIVSQFRKLDDLKSIMGMKFNEAKIEISNLLKDVQEIPDLIKQKIQYMSQWKSPERMVHLLNFWKHNRFDGDDAAWEAISYWYYGASVKPSTVWNGHNHLYLWFENLSDQIQRTRRDLYRVFASQLAKKYGTIYIEKFDLRDVIETPEPEKDTAYDKEARYNRSKAAVSVLRGAISNVASREGMELVQTDSEWITHTCLVCFEHIKFDARKTVECKCSKCGTAYDQDYLAAKNNLTRGLNLKTIGTA